jgi:hypothetical protein
MSGKCDVHADGEPKDKKEREVMSLLKKVQVLEKLDRQMGIAAVGCHSFIHSFIHSLNL